MNAMTKTPKIFNYFKYGLLNNSASVTKPLNKQYFFLL